MLCLYESAAVSYTKIAYQTAYLKANFPYEYMTALLESRKENEVEYDLLLKNAASALRRIGASFRKSNVRRFIYILYIIIIYYNI